MQDLGLVRERGEEADMQALLLLVVPTALSAAEKQMDPTVPSCDLGSWSFCTMSRENESTFLGLDPFECKIYPYVVGVGRILPRSHALSRSPQRDEASENRKWFKKGVPVTETVPLKDTARGWGEQKEIWILARS